MLTFKDNNGIHVITINMKIPGLILILVGIIILISGKLVIDKVNAELSVSSSSIGSFSFWVFAIIGIINFLAGINYLFNPEMMTIDTVNKLLIYKRKKIPYIDVSFFEYKYYTHNYARNHLVHHRNFWSRRNTIYLTLVKTNDRRLDLFPNARDIINYSPTMSLQQEKKEIYDYLVKVTGIKGKKILDDKEAQPESIK